MIYDNSLERNIKGINGIQSETKKSKVFSYKSEDKCVSIFLDDDSLLPDILINK